MKISKQIQKSYADSLRSNNAEDFEAIFLNTEELFVPMFAVSHGLISLDAINKINDNTIIQTIDLWDFNFANKNKTFFSWLYTKHLDTSRKFLSLVFKLKVDKLPVQDHLTFLNSMGRASYSFTSSLGKMPKASIESFGENYFVWLVRYGTLDQVKKEYQTGMEYLTDSAGYRVLSFLSDNRLEIRNWLFKNTKILQDPLFEYLDLELTEESYLPRPGNVPLFPLYKKSLKDALGVKSKLLLTTLKQKTKVFLNNSKTHNIIIDYYNVVFLIKQELPDLDENILNNVLLKINPRTNFSNLENFQEIVRMVWNNLGKYSEYRRLKLILNTNISLSNVEDIFRMINSKAIAADTFKMKLLPTKPNTLGQIHDYLNKIPEVLEVNRPLNFKFKNELNGYSSGSFTIRYPECEVDLIKIGLDLNICVGSEYYRTQSISGRADIFTIVENNKLIACVEVNREYGFFQVRQISGRTNSEVKSSCYEFLKKAFKDKYNDNNLSFYQSFEDQFY